MTNATDSVDLQTAKQVVRDLHSALDAAAPHQIEDVLATFTTSDWLWRGMHPFYEQTGAAAVADSFWKPLRTAFAPVQRRPDIFLAGVSSAIESEFAEPGSTWVMQMGHLLGLFDQPWIDIPPTRKMCFLRYAEFNRVGTDGKIHETAMFVDIPSVMSQAGHYPFAPQTGADHIQPGPRTHDGLLFDAQDPEAGPATLAVVDQMIADLVAVNDKAMATGDETYPYEVMAKSWTEDMIWSGPSGIGAAYTIDRYQQQHSYPFRYNLADKTFNGHVARMAEGNYACFFGWPNLTVRAIGGFMGMTSGEAADMRIVDVYRREGDKLAENWVFIDLLHWLSMQGLDVLQRMRQQLGLERFGGDNPHGGSP